MKGLSGKTAIVSGGATLIGRSVAATLAGYGMNVVIADINEADGAAAAAEIGAQARFMRCDIASDDDIAALVAQTKAATGRIDGLVNVACTYLDNGADTARADWLSAFNVNVAGSVALMQAARSELARTKGSIVNFGSGAQFGPKHYGVYAGVKAAIQAISRAAALEWAADGIRVNMVIPLVASPATDADPMPNEMLAKFVPLGRIGDPEADIGRPIAFLAGDDSRFITGSTLMLDGGLTFLR